MKVRVITQEFAKAATCRGARKTEYSDMSCPGFTLIVLPSGARSFHQWYRDADGRRHQKRIGSADVLTVSQAKQAAKNVKLHALLDTPVLRHPHQKRHLPTFEEFALGPYLRHARANKRSWRDDERKLVIHLVPAFGSLPLDQIKRKHIIEYADAKRRHLASVTVNGQVTLVRRIFNYAEELELPGCPENPTRKFKFAPEIGRSARLTEDDYSSLENALLSHPNRRLGIAIYAIMRTGARRSEILKAKWEDFWPDRHELVVPVSKNGRPRVITLPSDVTRLLVEHGRTPGSPFLLPNPTTGLPYQEVFKAWSSIRAKAGLPKLRIHDLRHAFASRLVERNVTLPIIKALLGHRQIRSTERYAHVSPESLRKAVEGF